MSAHLCRIATALLFLNFLPGPVSAAGGDLIWVFQGIENIECADEIEDQNADGVPDLIVETYDAGAVGDHLWCLSGDTPGTVAVPIWHVKPPGGLSSGGGYGDECVQTSPDLNGDGFQDVLLGTAWGGRTAYGIDGTDGSVIWSFDTYANRPPDPPESGWVYTITSVPDTDGDGHPDAFFGCGSFNDRVYHASGLGGGILWSHYVFDAVFDSATLDDVNGDDLGDVAIGVGDNADAVWVFRGGASAAPEIWHRNMPGSVLALDRIGDLDHDGINDIVAGTWASRVFAFSGATGDTIWIGILPGTTYVMKLATLDDVNGDGTPDVAVGSWDSRAFVLSGKDGTQIWAFPTGDDCWAVNRVEDVTGDGINDVVAGSFDNYVYLIDGMTGAEVWRYFTGNRLFYVMGTSDITGNGIPDVFAGTQMLSGAGGRGYLLEGGEPGTPAGMPVLAEAEEAPGGIALRLSNAFGVQACFVERTDGRPNGAAAVRAFREAVIAAYEEGLLTTTEAIQARQQDPHVRWSRVSQGNLGVAGGRAAYLDRTAEPGRTYTYRFSLLNEGVVVAYSPSVTVTRGAGEATVPRIVARPNPLAGATMEVEFRLPALQHVRLEAYDAAGRRVATLLDGPAEGDVSVTWAARDAEGARLTAGVYVLRLEGEGFVASGKATILR